MVNSINSHLYFESALGFGSNIHFLVALPRTSIAAPQAAEFGSLGPSSKGLVSKSRVEKMTVFML